MSLKLVFILLAIAGLSGIAFGYFLRWIVSLGKRGSMELEIKKKAEEIKEIREKMEKKAEEAKAELERIAKLSQEDAKQELLKAVEKKYEEDILVRMRKLELEGTEKLDRKARDILTTSIQRLASSTASEIMATTVSIPSDDLKGK